MGHESRGSSRRHQLSSIYLRGESQNGNQVSHVRTACSTSGMVGFYEPEMHSKLFRLRSSACLIFSGLKNTKLRSQNPEWR
jgi:hypothetical protein